MLLFNNATTAPRQNDGFQKYNQFARNIPSGFVLF